MAMCFGNATNTKINSHNCKLKVLTNGDQPENDVLHSRPTCNLSYSRHGPTNDQRQHNHPIEGIDAEKGAIRAMLTSCIQKAKGEKVGHHVKTEPRIKMEHGYEEETHVAPNWT